MGCPNLLHCSDATQALSHVKSLDTRLFAQQHVQANNKENFSVPYYYHSPHKTPSMWKAFPCHDIIGIAFSIHPPIIIWCISFFVSFFVCHTFGFCPFLEELLIRLIWNWTNAFVNDSPGLINTLKPSKKAVFFCRQHFQIHLHVRKILYYDLFVSETCFKPSK